MSAPRVEREWFAGAAAYEYARQLANDYDAARDGAWVEYVAWSAGYDLPRELAAHGVPADEIERERARIEGLA